MSENCEPFQESKVSDSLILQPAVKKTKKKLPKGYLYQDVNR